MSQILSAFISGMIFGFGLSLAEMVNPARVIGFLDFAGHWDPTLLTVMIGALVVTIPAFPLILRRSKPVLTEEFVLPTKTNIDRPLILGAMIFGIGWGIAGFCPGPALAALVSGQPAVILFVISMIAGQWFAARIERL